MTVMTLTTTMRPEVLPLAPTKTVEEVWQQPAVGTPWCEDGEHNLGLDEVLDVLYALGFNENMQSVTHAQIVRMSMELWLYEAVCAFFHLGVEDAAKRVHGVVADEYPLGEGLAIVKEFSDHWNGCPEQHCGGSWDEFGEMQYP